MNKNEIINKKVSINYFDQNYAFETIFPLTGVIIEKLKVDARECYIVNFEKPFTYKNRAIEKIVITERHVGDFIGNEEEIHVHVFLPRFELNRDIYEFSNFDHVVWATVTLNDHH